MFAQIETKGASHILINVPHEGAEKSLPALAAMLEKNAVFISIGYSEVKVVEPQMSIILGDKVDLGNYQKEEIVVKVEGSGDVLDETFVAATPQVLTSNAKAIRAKEDEIARIRTESNFLKQEMESWRTKFEELSDRYNELLNTRGE